MLAYFTRPKIAAAAILVVFILLLAAFAIGVWAVSFGDRDAVTLLLMTFLPIPFYLWAIWSARRAVLLIGSEGALRAILSSMLARIGWALLAGGLVRTFIVPWGIRLAMGFGPYAAFDAAAITVGVVGVTLVIVSRIVAEAEAIRAELDEFL